MIQIREENHLATFVVGSLRRS